MSEPGLDSLVAIAAQAANQEEAPVPHFMPLAPPPSGMDHYHHPGHFMHPYLPPPPPLPPSLPPRSSKKRAWGAEDASESQANKRGSFNNGGAPHPPPGPYYPPYAFHHGHHAPPPPMPYHLPHITNGAGGVEGVAMSPPGQSMMMQQRQQALQHAFSPRKTWPWGDNPRLNMLLHSLSSRVRQFAVFEWFYSTLDRGFFNHNDFQDALDLHGLGHIKTLTRTEWSAVRSSLGRPRRLSAAFFQQQRQRLETYRRTVRDIQNGNLSPPPLGFMFEIPTRLVVGQSVSAYHKRAKLLARGKILTADYERCYYRINFERPELDTEVCRDTDIAMHGAPVLLFAKPRRRVMTTTTSSMQGLLLPPALPMVVGRQGNEDDVAKEAQVKLMVFIGKMLDRKEALLTAIRELNEQANMATTVAMSPTLAYGSNIDNGHSDLVSSVLGSSDLEYSLIFRQQFAWAVNALQRTNAALTTALERLQQLTRNGASGSSGIGMYQGVRVSGMARETIESARVEAATAFQQHKRIKTGDLQALDTTDETSATTVGNLILEEGGSVQELVEAGASILFTLQRCAAERHTWLRSVQEEEEEDNDDDETGRHMTAMDAEQSMGAAVLELKRRCVLGMKKGEDVEEVQEKMRLLQEIESSVNVLKNELL